MEKLRLYLNRSVVYVLHFERFSLGEQKLKTKNKYLKQIYSTSTVFIFILASLCRELFIISTELNKNVCINFNPQICK